MEIGEKEWNHGHEAVLHVFILYEACAFLVIIKNGINHWKSNSNKWLVR